MYEKTNQWESMKRPELAEFVKTKFAEMETIYTESTEEGSTTKSLTKDQGDEFKSRNEELTAATERLQALNAVDEGLKKARDANKSLFETNRTLPFPNGGQGGGEGEGEGQGFKSLGDMFVESKPYTDSERKDLANNGNIKAEIGGVTIKSIELGHLKATMSTGAGWAPYPTLSPRPITYIPQRRPVVADVIPQDDTDQVTIVYYEETVFTNNAAPTAEGGLKPEAALQAVQRQQPVQKISVTLPVTDEQLMDVPQVRGYIDARLTLMIQLIEENQLLGGNGTAPNLMGFHSKPGIGSIARGASEDNADVILRGITDINQIVGFANASAIIMHPAQWLAIRLIRTTVGDYIWGHPSLQGPQTLWGLPVIVTPAETAGRALIGDFQMYSHISRRMGLRIDVGFVGDDFQRDIQRIRLSERLSLEIYRASAFEEVTNLNAAA